MRYKTDVQCVSDAALTLLGCLMFGLPALLLLAIFPIALSLTILTPLVVFGYLINNAQ